MRFFLTILLLLAGSTGSAAQDTLRMLFAGDVMQHQRQLDAARGSGGLYRYDDCFKYVKKYIDASDLAITNLETTLGESGFSGYPAFCSPDELAAALQRAGFDLLLTANNHSCDRGRRGILRTISALDSLGIPHTGTFASDSARRQSYPFILEQGAFRLALLNYTYGTNGIDIPPPTVVNLIDTVQIAADIAAARLRSPDLIVANMHWGEEYQLMPSGEQRRLADFLIRQGVELVIGSHPHVLQPMERHPENAVVYSLGNFISAMSAENTQIGTMVEIEAVKEAGKTRIARCGYRLTWVHKPVEAGRQQFQVIPVADYENDSSFFGTPWELQRMKASAVAMRKLFGRENLRFTEYTGRETRSTKDKELFRLPDYVGYDVKRWE